ncbi:MAG: hypothetical protein AAFV80_21600, partial [Bacteroidota bacterium]
MMEVPMAPESSAAILKDYCYMEINYDRDELATKYLRYKRIKILKKEGFKEGNITLVYQSEDNYEIIRNL